MFNITSSTSRHWASRNSNGGLAPVANFGISISGPANNDDLVSFFSTSTGNPTALYWEITEPSGSTYGTSTSESLSSILLSPPGVWTISLAVSNAFGNSECVKKILVWPSSFIWRLYSYDETYSFSGAAFLDNVACSAFVPPNIPPPIGSIGLIQANKLKTQRENFPPSSIFPFVPTVRPDLETMDVYVPPQYDNFNPAVLALTAPGGTSSVASNGVYDNRFSSPGETYNTASFDVTVSGDTYVVSAITTLVTCGVGTFLKVLGNQLGGQTPLNDMYCTVTSIIPVPGPFSSVGNIVSVGNIIGTPATEFNVVDGTVFSSVTAQITASFAIRDYGITTIGKYCSPEPGVQTFIRCVPGPIQYRQGTANEVAKNIENLTNDVEVLYMNMQNQDDIFNGTTLTYSCLGYIRRRSLELDYLTTVPSDMNSYYQVTDKYFNQVELLLLSDTSPGTTTFIDSSSKNRDITNIGNTIITGSTPLRWNNSPSSINFTNPTTTRGLIVSDIPDISFNADFTIEAWVYINSVGKHGFVCLGGSDSSSRRQLMTRTSGLLAVSNGSGSGSASGYTMTGTTVVSAGRWHHVAWVRWSGNQYLFLNGNLESTTFSTSRYNPTSINIGAYTSSGTGDLLNGFIDSVRITNLVPRYVSNFNPVPRPFALST